MAINEVAWQTKIIKRVKNEGSYGKKWATHLTVGVPDLILSLHGVGLIAPEVKLEKGWTGNTTRTIAVTPKQQENIIGILDTDGVSYVLLVVDNGPKDTWLSKFNPAPMGEALRIPRDRTRQFNWYDKNLHLTDFLRGRAND